MRFRIGLACLVTVVAAGLLSVVPTGGGVAVAVPSTLGPCAGDLTGATFTLSGNCATTVPILVPNTITTVDGGNFTISATDVGQALFGGGVLQNASPGQTMDIKNVTISGQGFQLPAASCPSPVYGIWFNDASGTVNNVTVEHIWQVQGDFGSCQAVKGILAQGTTAARTVTITDTRVLDYQKNGIDARGSMTMDVSGSTIGPPHPLAGLSAQNGLAYVTSGGLAPGGTATNNKIFGSGDAQTGFGGSSAGTAVIIFGAKNVTITKNMITSDPSTTGTDIGVSVSTGSTGIVISFNEIGRTAPDVPDPFGLGVDVFTPDGSMATLICNTFTMWNTNIVGALQIDPCTPLPPGSECQAYSAPTPSVESGKNYEKTEPFAIIGTAPFTWTVGSGTLPPGLSLAGSNGAITGTPTAAGTFNFTLKVVDSTGLTATQPQTITIPAASCVPPEEVGEDPSIPEASEPGEGPVAPIAPITPISVPVTG